MSIIILVYYKTTIYILFVKLSVEQKTNEYKNIKNTSNVTLLSKILILFVIYYRLRNIS